MFGKARPFAGQQSERMPWLAMRTCTSTRTGLHPVSHASPVTKGARKSQEGRDPTAQAALSFLLRSFGLRVSHVPRAHLKSVVCGRRALGLSGSALEAERRGITRSSLRRTELESSLHPKRKKRAALRAHRAWQRLQGQPLWRARTALAVFVLVCRTLKTRCRSRKAASGPEKHPHQSDKRM